jgi:hypothetical protein
MRLRTILRIGIPVVLAIALARALVMHDDVGQAELFVSGFIVAGLLVFALRGAIRRV